MTRQWCSALAGALVLLGFGGCRPSAYEPSTQAEAQKIYSQTKWYFARQIAFSKPGSEPAEAVTDNNRTQIFFQLASGTRINYTEFQPGGGIKAFHGLGRLESIPEVAGPVYRRPSSYAPGNLEKVVVVGFCGKRMFRVEAQGTVEQRALQDAVSVATNALSSLRHQARNP